MATDGQQKAQRGSTPPYVSWTTTKGFIQDLHEHGVPTRIDRSVLHKMSGASATQLLTALRFLDLIDHDGVPSPRLATLAKSYETDDWTTALQDMVRNSYAPLFELDLASATPGHFNETFRKAFPGADAVQQKSATFFLYAAKEAGIEISGRVLSGRKPRPLARVRSAARKRNGGAAPVAPEGSPAPTSALGDGGAGVGDALDLDPLLIALLKKIPAKGEQWPAPQRIRWFRTFAMNVSQVYDEDDAAVDLDIKAQEL